MMKEVSYLSQQVYLESCYFEANQEIDDAFEISTSDGVEEDEAW